MIQYKLTRRIHPVLILGILIDLGAFSKSAVLSCQILNRGSNLNPVFIMLTGVFQRLTTYMYVVEWDRDTRVGFYGCELPQCLEGPSPFPSFLADCYLDACTSSDNKGCSQDKLSGRLGEIQKEVWFYFCFPVVDTAWFTLMVFYHIQTIWNGAHPSRKVRRRLSWSGPPLSSHSFTSHFAFTERNISSSHTPITSTRPVSSTNVYQSC